jgi:rod shape-determining protein MreD
MNFTLKWVGIFLLCLILQTTLIPAIGILGASPDLLMVALFFLARKTGPFAATWVGFFLGLAEDLYSPSILGQNALSRTAAGFFAGLFNERVMRVDFIFQLVLLLVTFFIHDALYYTVQMIKTNSTGAGGFLHVLVTSTLPRTLYSLLFALFPAVKNLVFPTSSRR